MTIEPSFRIRLLRHGNTFNDNEPPYQVGLKSDLSLTEKGIMQAQRFKECLQKTEETPFAIYSGSLKRQMTTATLLHQSFPKAKLYTHEQALNELDYGLWEGLTTEEIKAKWPQEYRAWQDEAKWPKGIVENSLEHHLELLNQWIETLRREAPNNALVVAVSSQGIIRLMLHFIPNLWKTLSQEKRMGEYKVGTGHYCDFKLTPSSLSAVSWNQSP